MGSMADDDALPMVTSHEDQMLQTLAAVEQADVAGQIPTFLGNQRMFLDQMYQGLPDLAERLTRFVTAETEDILTPKGMLVTKVPVQDSNGKALNMSDGQLAIAKTLLSKALPSMKPVDEQGKAGALETNNVKITINNVGGDVDFEQMPGSLAGVVRANAQQTAPITIEGTTDGANVHLPPVSDQGTQVPQQAVPEEARTQPVEVTAEPVKAEETVTFEDLP